MNLLTPPPITQIRSTYFWNTRLSVHYHAYCVISELALEPPATKSCARVTSFRWRPEGEGGLGCDVELVSLEPFAEAEC